MERVKAQRAKYRAQFIPIDEMFTAQELNDLQEAFDKVSQGDDFVNMLSLKTLFAEMRFYPSDEVLDNLLRSCGMPEDQDEVSFELFARALALLMDEKNVNICLLYTSPSPRDKRQSRMPSSA